MSKIKYSAVGSFVLMLLIVLVVGGMIYVRSGEDDAATYDDTVEIHELAADFFNAIGSGDTEFIRENSCKDGLYSNPEDAMLKVLEGMRVVGVDETLKASKPTVKGRVSFDYGNKSPDSLEPDDHEVRSQVVTFKYSDGDWCVWG